MSTTSSSSSSTTITTSSRTQQRQHWSVGGFAGAWYRMRLDEAHVVRRAARRSTRTTEDEMALLGCIKVWEGGVSGTNPIWTGAEFYERIAQGEKWFLQARATQTSGTNPSLDVKLQDSCDGINWRDKSTLITAAANNIPINTVTTLYGNDTGTSNVAGSKMRVQIILGGTNPNAFLELWLTIRTND